jgi:hypothetical protein
MTDRDPVVLGWFLVHYGEEGTPLAYVTADGTLTQDRSRALRFADAAAVHAGRAALGLRGVYAVVPDVVAPADDSTGGS